MIQNEVAKPFRLMNLSKNDCFIKLILKIKLIYNTSKWYFI
jgi:hypothetical protein